MVIVSEFTGDNVAYRRLSKWRRGPKLKPRVYYADQETTSVRSVGRVRVVFSTMKKATPLQRLLTAALPPEFRTAT